MPLPDNFNSAAFDRAWGGPPPESDNACYFLEDQIKEITEKLTSALVEFAAKVPSEFSTPSRDEIEDSVYDMVVNTLFADAIEQAGDVLTELQVRNDLYVAPSTKRRRENYEHDRKRRQMDEQLRSIPTNPNTLKQTGAL